MFYFISMLIVRTDQPNTMVVTVSQNSELTNPEYLFSFVHIFSKERVSFIPTDISTHKSRYDEFYFVEGSGVGEVDFPYAGLYLYSISEQPNGSGNLDPALATNVVENGEAQIIVSTAITTDSQFDIFVSNNEDNSNIIFAPDEPNPAPPVTPSITPSNSPTPSITPTNTSTPNATPTSTPTPSITPTLTPTPSTTPPANINPSGYTALWWSQLSNPSFLNLSGNNSIISVIDGVDGTTLFKGGDDALGPMGKGKFVSGVYPSTELNYSGSGLFNVGVSNETITSLNGDYPSLTASTDFTFFSRHYFTGSTNEQALFSSDYNGGQTNSTLWDGSVVPYRWFQLKYQGGNIEFNRWFNPNIDNGFVGFNITASGNTWIDLAWRTYQDGSTCKSECWINGSIVNSGQTTYVAVAPATAPGQIQGTNFEGYIAEQFYFNRKLTDIEMGDMFTYLTNRY